MLGSYKAVGLVIAWTMLVGASPVGVDEGGSKPKRFCPEYATSAISTDLSTGVEFRTAMMVDDFGGRRRPPRSEACMDTCWDNYEIDSQGCGLEASNSQKALCYARAMSRYAKCVSQC